MGCECESLNGTIVNRFQVIHDDDWTFTSMDKNWQSNIFHLWFEIYSLKLQHPQLLSDYC